MRFLVFLHFDSDFSAILEVQPEHTGTLGSSPGLSGEHFLLQYACLGAKGLSGFSDSKCQVVFYDEGSAEASATQQVLIHPDDAIVAGEAILRVGAHQTRSPTLHLVHLSEVEGLVLEEAAPGVEVREHLQRVGSLATQKPSWWVLVVHTE